MATTVWVVLCVAALLGLAVGVVVLLVRVLGRESRAVETVRPPSPGDVKPADEPVTRSATPEDR